MKANASHYAILDSTRITKAASWWRSIEYGLLFCSDIDLQRLTHDLEPMAPARRQLMQEKHAVGRPRPLAGHGHLPAADQAHLGDGLQRGAAGASRDQGRPGAREAGTAVEARGLEGPSQGHGGQNGREPLRQPRRARPSGPQEENVMVKMPASASVSRVILQQCAARTPELTVLVSATPVASYGASLMYSRCV
jgi:hypothetical protein